MWIQDIEMAIEALKQQADPMFTLISCISFGDGFIIFTSTGGEKYCYDIRGGDIQTGDENNLQRLIQVLTGDKKVAGQGDYPGRPVRVRCGPNSPFNLRIQNFYTLYQSI